MYNYMGKIRIDSILWNTLTLSGIHVCKFATKLLRYISWIVVILMHISTAYISYLKCRIVVTKRELPLNTAAFFLQYFFAFLLWRHLFTKRKVISRVLCQIYYFRRLLDVHSRKSSLFVNATLIVIILATFGLIIHKSMSVKSGESTDTFWTDGVKDMQYKHILAVVDVTLYYTTSIYVPGLVSLAFSTIEYRSGEVVKAFNDHFKKLLEIENSQNAAGMVKLFNKISDTLQEVKELLSFPLFMLTTYNFFVILAGLSTVLSYGETMSVTDLIKVGFVSSLSCLSILSQGMCGCLIPENLELIRKTAGKVVEKYKRNCSEDNKFHFYFKRVERQKIIYLTAYGMFDIKRNFCLNAFGAILTYGLLIINLKR